MGLAGPNGPTEKRRAELIGGLYLVGARGKCCAVITERQLTIERIDGKGFRLDLAAIERMRHLKIPVLPSGTNLIGLVAIYLGFTTIVSPINWLAVALGASIIISNIVSRYAILAIETGSGDRHLVSGSEGDLLKLCLIVDRVRHGSNMDEAMLGLENLETEIPTFPALRDVAGVLGEKPVASLPFSTRSEAFTPHQEDRLPIMEIFEGDKVKLEPPETTSERADIVDRKNTEAIYSPSFSKQNAYERAWGVQETPTWYKEKEAESKPSSRIDSVFSDAAEGLDMFSPGGLFDSGTISDSSNTNEVEMGLFDFELDSPKQDSGERSFSSSQMIKRAHEELGAPVEPFRGKLLPPPTEEAVREECKAGVVRQARAMQELRTKSNDKFSYAQSANLDDYPALKGLASTMSGNRTAVVKPKAGVSGGWLSRLLRPSSSMNRHRRSDAGTTDEIETERFQSTQHMRLRSDQDHQADVSARIRSMRTVVHSSTAKDKLDSIVSGLSGKDDERLMLTDNRDSLKFGQLKPTSSTDDSHPLPGLKRLG